MNTVGLAVMALGLFLIAVTAVGFIRLPDFFTRVHAVSKSETLGITLILGGLIIHGGLTVTSLKFAMVVLFIAVANPVGAHLLTRAAVRAGLLPWRRPRDPMREEA
jgi:multicomponent Na+:H+ antiporter subunit G